MLQPSGWPMPKGYANGMAAEGRLVVTGGVIGWDTKAHLPADFVAQVRQALSNIAAILGEGGARPEHLVRLTWYVVDIEEYLANLKALGQSLSRDLRRALSGDGAGPGRPSGRKGGAGRDRGDRGGPTLTALPIFCASGRFDPHCDCKRHPCEYRAAGNPVASAACRGALPRPVCDPLLSELHQEQKVQPAQIGNEG